MGCGLKERSGTRVTITLFCTILEPEAGTCVVVLLAPGVIHLSSSTIALSSSLVLSLLNPLQTALSHLNLRIQAVGIGVHPPHIAVHFFIYSQLIYDDTSTTSMK